MRLKKIQIRNFRKINDLEIEFSKGLSLIVGENNAGKSSIIDALRLLLFSSRDYDSPKINEDDFSNGIDFEPIEISCTFSDLDENDEVRYSECLITLPNGEFEAKLNLRIEYNSDTRRPNFKTWGGETESGTLPNDAFDYISSIYLKPLRDPEAGLKPSRFSQITRLLDSLTEEDKYQEFEDIANNANEKIKELKPIIEAKTQIDQQLVQITGQELAQKTDLIFSDSSFHKIISGLKAQIDGLPYNLNGLGYNNLVYTAMTLGTLDSNSSFSFKAILIEEPEAHLHPQLQTLLLRHLVKVTEKSDNPVQVICTTHSPIFASSAPIDSIISLYNNSDGSIDKLEVQKINVDVKLKNKLERFLDATRAELFFAKRIIMVEGIAELLLIPILGDIFGINLKEASITLINTNGLNFNAFIPLFGEKRIEIPVLILTDGDDKEKTGTPSTQALSLKKEELNVKNLRVEFGEITFEHELAKSEKMLDLMLNAFEEIFPENGKKLRENIKEAGNQEEKADLFLSEFIRNKTSKGIFAQELADELKKNISDLNENTLPLYIKSGFDFLKQLIIKNDGGNPQETNS